MDKSWGKRRACGLPQCPRTNPEGFDWNWTVTTHIKPQQSENGVYNSVDVLCCLFVWFHKYCLHFYLYFHRVFMLPTCLPTQAPYNSMEGWFALSQWETALLCNDVSHWMGTSLESVLAFTYHCIYMTIHIKEHSHSHIKNILQTHVTHMWK